MKMPYSITALIENFDRNKEAYLDNRYNETQLRREFIDPFFIALGWDVNNTKGYAHAYKDVIHEDSIRIGSATKAPDYCFRIGGTRKFFIEAKKPSVNIKDAPHPAFQLRRYAWSAKLPLSILTDFEEFAVYDCRIKPLKTDSASAARIKYIKYTEYPERWEEIASIFSLDAILKGSFDKFAESAKKKKGTAEVDAAFLAEIEKWRDSLAKNIALRNPSLSNRQLNFAVQRTIDRIIFLRICEDRGIERYSELLAQTNGSKIYQRLFTLFRKADDRYNSGLFHFTKEPNRPDTLDELTPKLKIDDKPLKQIIKSLYYPDCPYEFSVLPAEILGHVYEQFLGKVIRLTASHQAKIEEKPEVKKAGGVYYTPSYIVDYIVKNTVGKLLENKTPAQAAKLKILDPACGSGSFLIGAYQYLLDWHLKYYSQNNPEKYLKKKNPPITTDPSARPSHSLSSTNKSRADQSCHSRDQSCHSREGGNPQQSITSYQSYKLTTHERKRILLNNIFGVDIDTQAVEVTKLSLLLKVLEGEKQLVLFHKERALPDLANNIKCGNSLIAPDFYQAKQMMLFDEEQTFKINAFDWKAEFPKIFNKKSPGFDTVIGNPPWGGDIDHITDYITTHYPNSTASYRDSFKLFIEKGITLTARTGLFSFIVPSALMFQPRYLDIRRFIKKYIILYLWNIGDKVFSPKVSAPCCVIGIQKQPPKFSAIVSLLDTAETTNNATRSELSKTPVYRMLPQSTYDKTTEETFVTFYRQLRPNEVTLDELLDCKDCGIKHQRVGVGMEQKGKSDLASRLYYEGPKESKTDHRYLIGSDLRISRWHIDFSTERYLRGNYQEILRDNEIVYFNRSVFELPEKIIWRQTSDRIRATILGPYWFANTLQAGVLKNTQYNLRYILGLLNSKFLNFIYIETVKELGRVFPQVKMAKVRALPIRTIDFSNPKDKARHNKMVSLVETMLQLHKDLSAAKTPDEKNALQRQITATDKQIDSLVYKLYNLTDDEIKIIEQSSK